MDGPDLTELAERHGTDKWGGHRYARHYHDHFAPLRHMPITLLEIGIGGYGEPTAGGESLRMWRDFFPNARIYGLDIADKSPHNEERIRTVVGSQADPAILSKLSEEAGGFDIVIDDGSHMSSHVTTSFQTLFPLLKPDGIYAIEDLQTSYWKLFGGSSDIASRPPTSMEFLKALIDGLNYREFDRPGYQPTYFDENIFSMHFYHNLCFIYKGDNTRESIWVNNNILTPAIRSPD